MASLKFCLFRCDGEAGFSEQRIRHQASAPADAPVNAPRGQFDTTAFQGFSPGQYVLVNAIHQRAVQIEEEGRYLIRRF